MESFGEFGLVGLVMAVVLTQTFALAKEALRGRREKNADTKNGADMDPDMVRWHAGMVTGSIDKLSDQLVKLNDNMVRFSENQKVIKEDIRELIAAVRGH